MNYRDDEDVHLSPSRKGDISEHVSISILQQEGLEVFHNSGCDGPIDIVTVDLVTGEITMVDVKTSTVDHENKVVYWSKRCSEDYAVEVLTMNIVQIAPGITVHGWSPEQLSDRVSEYGYSLGSDRVTKPIQYKEYTLEDPSGQLHRVIGLDSVSELTGLKGNRRNTLLYSNAEVEGWTFESSRVIQKYRLPSGSDVDSLI